MQDDKCVLENNHEEQKHTDRMINRANTGGQPSPFRRGERNLRVQYDHLRRHPRREELGFCIITRISCTGSVGVLPRAEGRRNDDDRNGKILDVVGDVELEFLGLGIDVSKNRNKST